MVQSNVALRAETPSVEFGLVYAETFPAVWRAVGKLGVPKAARDDVVQDIFVAVFRRLGDFRGESTLKTWVFSIAIRIVSNYRRTNQRKGAGRALDTEVDDPALLVDDRETALDVVARREAMQLVDRVLSGLGQEKAMVFVLAEFEAMTVAEISVILGLNINTAASRLRAARREFEQQVMSLDSAHELGKE